ncbi:MAG: hypothetical protein EA358_04935, partial [Flavobacteriales bacterium]
MFRNIFTATLLIAQVVNLKAQISIDRWGFLAPSESVLIGSANVVNISHTPPGPNQTWNYASLQDNFTRQFFYTPAQWHSGNQFFPNAAFAHEISGETMFLNVNDSAYDILGFYADPFFTGNLNPYPLTPSKRELAFPMFYGQTWQNTSSEIATDYDIMNADSLISAITTFRTATIDAWGTVTTPLGTFEALRLHTFDSIIITITIYKNGSIVSTQNDLDKIHQYSFYSNNPNAKYYLVKYRYEPQFNEIFKLEWQKSSPVLSLTSLGAQSDFDIYPNPAVGSCIVSNLPADSHVSLTSLNGQILAVFNNQSEDLHLALDHL